MVGELLNTGNALDMNRINTTYNNLIRIERPESFKLYLKILLSENVKNIVFNQFSARDQLERLCSSNIGAVTINSFDNSSDDFKTIFQASKSIRAKILKQQKQLFEVTFQECTIPQELQPLLHRMITGPKHALDFNSGKKKEIEKSIDTVGQVSINSSKTERQITNINNKTFRQVIETTFTGVAFRVHMLTRS